MKNPSEMTLSEIEAIAIRYGDTPVTDVLTQVKRYIEFHNDRARAYVVPPPKPKEEKPKRCKSKVDWKYDAKFAEGKVL